MRLFVVAAMLAVAALAVEAESLQAAGVPAPVSATLDERIATAAPDAWLDIIVNFETFADVHRAPFDALDVRVFYEIQAVPSVLAWVQAAQLPALRAVPGVTLIENNDPLEYDMDTAILAGNVHGLWATDKPNITVDGAAIDGTGITVAVVDTGVNAKHDDLKLGPKVVRDLMALGVASTTVNQDPIYGGPGTVLMWRDTDDSDGGGHGSHVAGIVAGTGELSGGKFRGSAPGATLVGLGSPVGTVWYGVAAWDWVFQNHDDVTPPIRIVTNSWGYALGDPCDTDIALTRIEKQLILELGITMFFSVGNSAGDGSTDSTRTQFKCPWEGAIGVASYDDQNSGTRDSILSRTSSRGAKEDPVTWPDIAAPGVNITATNGHPLSSGTAAYAVDCQAKRDLSMGAEGCYAVKSGTSMATPFTAGVGALLLQVRPDLKPADVEFILEQTAYKFDAVDEPYASGFNDYRHDGSHYARGHGLVDAEAAVAFALTYDAAAYPIVYGAGETPAPMPVDAAPAEAAAESPGMAPLLMLAVLATLSLAMRRR